MNDCESTAPVLTDDIQFVFCLTAEKVLNSRICSPFVRHVPPCRARFDLRAELTAHLNVVFVPAANFVPG